MDYKKDYYQILEVPLTASQEEIRAAYRRMAKLYHPDKNAGDAEAEEKFKQINEANEVLSYEILKDEYDAYRAEQERWEKSQAEQGSRKDEIKQTNKKTYTKTKTVVTETRIYIRGEITIKYWADTKDPVAASYNTVLDYKINPTEAAVTISEENIFPMEGIPLDYLRAFRESDIFAVPVPQPIRCEVSGESGKEYFKLTLNDLRIKSIRLEGVTKHENISYGTLKGQFYAYSPKLTYEEVEETGTECFGETGNIERKEEGGFNFIRKEYYHPDCSKYWGNWIQLPKARAYEPGRARTQSFRNNYSYSNDPGCGLFVWVIALLSILFLSPKFFIFCLVLAGLGILIHYGGTIFSSVGRLLSVLGAGLFLLFLITAVRSISTPKTTYIKKKETTGSVKTSKTVRLSPATRDSGTTSSDTLITHFLKWEDYAGKSYEGNISISVSALRRANTMHEKMSANFYQDISEIYKSMADHDSAALLYMYETFDSIKALNKLDEVAFSQVLVAAIQSQPYYLVLDKGCDDNYNDDFTRNYLENCKTDCCIGNELFGVRSPVEFLSDLKGDCDTRALLLYQLLRHYDYNVALLTSTYYKHAMVAVSFTEPVNQPGLSITIEDKKYYMWETTSPHLNYGEVASSLNNLAFWEISLLNKKIQYEIDPEHL
jgi:hypothetical protein